MEIRYNKKEIIPVWKGVGPVNDILRSLAANVTDFLIYLAIALVAVIGIAKYELEEPITVLTITSCFRHKNLPPS